MCMFSTPSDAYDPPMGPSGGDARTCDDMSGRVTTGKKIVKDRYGRSRIVKVPTGPVPPGHKPATDAQLLLANWIASTVGKDIPMSNSCRKFSDFISRNKDEFERRKDENDADAFYEEDDAEAAYYYDEQW